MVSGIAASSRSRAAATSCSRNSGLPPAAARIRPRRSPVSAVSAASTSSRASASPAGSVSSSVELALSPPPPQSGRVSSSSGTGEREEQDRPLPELDEVLDEVEERGGRPVQVLEHEDDRTAARKRFEQAADRPGGLVDGGRLRCLAQRGGHAEGRRLAVRVVGEHLRGPVADRARGDRLQRVAQRRVRGGVAVGRRAADETGRRSGQPVGDLAGEARLADARRAEHGHEPRPPVAGRPPEGRHDLVELVLAPDERRLESADDGLRLLVHALDGVAAVPPLGRDRMADEPPGAVADEHVGAGGRQQPVGLLERRSRDARAALGRVARDDVTGRDAGAHDEARGAQLARRADRAQGVVLARRRDAEDAEDARVACAAGLAAVRRQGVGCLALQAAELLAARLRIR